MIKKLIKLLTPNTELAKALVFIEKLLGLIKQGYSTILIWGGIALSAPFLFYFDLFTSLFMI